MVNCTGLTSGLEKVPFAGGSLSSNMAALIEGLQWVIEGFVSGEPVAIAAALVITFLLLGALALIYRFTRAGAAIIALTGFFLLSLCSL
ncbi:MAG: hypothetical protein MUP63_03185 [Candidatus Nanohaloarchaeota archaeon QJJ-7]|nr:hypothetical protein [Candidatus Nanohaloarchaeota archaeon QJJ-7]